MASNFPNLHLSQVPCPLHFILRVKTEILTKESSLFFHFSAVF